MLSIDENCHRQLTTITSHQVGCLKCSWSDSFGDDSMRAGCGVFCEGLSCRRVDRPDRATLAKSTSPHDIASHSPTPSAEGHRQKKKNGFDEDLKG